jgi:hypothetical protein
VHADYTVIVEDVEMLLSSPGGGSGRKKPSIAKVAKVR